MIQLRVYVLQRYKYINAASNIWLQHVQHMFLSKKLDDLQHVQHMFLSKKLDDLQHVQHMFLSKKLDDLQHVQHMFLSKKLDDLKKYLNVFIDKHGLFSCWGRYDNSSLPKQKKYPILLLTDFHLTALVIKDSHKGVLHNGVPETINEIRCKYWIIRIRQMLKNVINRCVTCKKS